MDSEGYLIIEPGTTLSEARQALGSSYMNLSDDQVQALIVTLTLIARTSCAIRGSKIY